MSASEARLTAQQPPVFSSETAPRPHVVQFYKQDRELVAEISRVLEQAIRRNQAVVVIATPAHRRAFARRLRARGVDLTGATREGRYIALDAAEMLPLFVVGGMPDEKLFEEVIGGVMAKASMAARDLENSVVTFGEMVALLWAEGNHAAALLLEELWNSLSLKQRFSLWCAYPMDDFKTDEHGELFEKICDSHSAVLPAKSSQPDPTDDAELGGAESRTIAKLQQQVRVLQHRTALKESEERFRLLVDAVQDYAIFMLDPDGYISSWNIGAERIKGYKAAEILGKHFSQFYPEEDVRAGKPERELEIARREGKVHDEGWRIRKDGSRFWAFVVITALKDHEGNIIGFAKVTRDFTERMQTQRALEESKRRLAASEESLRQLSLRLLRTQDEERRRIARDLHDSLGQYLSVLKMKLDFLGGQGASQDADSTEELAECAELTDSAIKEVRTISYLLYPPMLEELGLKSAIPWYVEGFTKRSGIQTSFKISPGFGRLGGDVELVLFRILQESLTNVHRHSESPTADVQLVVEGNKVILTISDHGKGVRPGVFEGCGNDWTVVQGVGLRGMSERIMQVGGRLDISSTSKGTTVTATVPVAPEPSS